MDYLLDQIRYWIMSSLQLKQDKMEINEQHPYFHHFWLSCYDSYKINVQVNLISMKYFINNHEEGMFVWFLTVFVNNYAISWTGPKTNLNAATCEKERGDHVFCLSRSHYTDTVPTRSQTQDLLTRSLTLYQLNYSVPHHEQGKPSKYLFFYFSSNQK